jgi:hypothetical protein
MWCRSSWPLTSESGTFCRLDPTVAGTRVELAAKRVGKSMVIEPSPVLISQSPSVVLPSSARIAMRPSPLRARTRVSLPVTRTLPSPGIGVHSASHVVQIDRPITRVHAEIAGEAAPMDAAVA